MPKGWKGSSGASGTGGVGNQRLRPPEAEGGRLQDRNRCLWGERSLSIHGCSHTMPQVPQEAEAGPEGTRQSKTKPFHHTNSFWGAQPPPLCSADPAALWSSAQEPSKFEGLCFAPDMGWPLAVPASFGWPRRSRRRSKYLWALRWAWRQAS